MFLILNEIQDGPRAVDASLDLPGALNESGERLVVGPARLTGETRPGTEGLELTGRVEARVSLRCSRCLESFETGLAAEFSLVLVPDAVEFGPGEAEVNASEAALFYAEGGRVDLRAVATEQIDLNLPLKPVCGPSCAGLCSSCGANRNRIECSCRREDVDPRLAPLLDLLERNKGPNDR